jgi:hypothetical protein
LTPLRAIIDKAVQEADAQPVYRYRYLSLEPERM